MDGGGRLAIAEIAISLAISAAVSAATAGLQYALTPKPKKSAPVDRGKQDDIRISIPAVGAHIPKGWGTFRVAPVWVWHTPIVHTTRTTPGSEGGKGSGGNPPTPDTIEHVYTKNFAGVFHDGPIYGGVNRIWFNNELVYNANLATNFADTASDHYEAEHGVLAGGAVVATQAECSGGRKVSNIGNGGSVTIHVDVDATATYEVAVDYTATIERTFKISVNGGALQDLVCPATNAGNIVGAQTILLSLNAGANTIKFENAGAQAPDLDRIRIATRLSFTPPTDPRPQIDPRPFTGITNLNRIAPTDQDTQWPVDDEQPVFSDAEAGGITAGGFYSATLAKWGNPQIRIYPGSEEQPQDPLLVSVMGVDQTPAYRGTGFLVLEGVQLQNGQPPNVTIEVWQGTREAAIIVSDIYNEVGVSASDLVVTALAGKTLGDDPSDFQSGTYAAITWTGLNNATQTGGGAITKTSGADNTWNSYANNGATVAAGTDAAIRFTAGAGVYMIGFAYTTTPGSTLPNPYNQIPFAVLLNINSNPSQEARNAIQMSLGGSSNSSDVGVWAPPGDQFQVEYRNGRFAAYQNGLFLSGFVPPVPTTFPLIPIFMGYKLGGGPSAASFASGANIGSAPIVAFGGGLLLDTQREAGELIEELALRFRFELPEVDGKVKAVMLDASPDLTVTHDEARAFRGDGQPPDVEINRGNPLLWPKVTEVNYLDPQLDFHNNTQQEIRLIGSQQGTISINLALIENADNMKALAMTVSDRAEVESQTYKFNCGPKYARIHQGTVLTVTMPASTHIVRVKDIKEDLPLGLIEVEGVRQQASVFSPNAAGAQGTGVEQPIVPIPGATKGIIIDGPLMRAEDAGDGTQPVVYVGMCGRGSGDWQAAFFYKEVPHDSGNYELQTVATVVSGIGKVSSGSLSSSAHPELWDRTSSLTIDFYDVVSLQSVTETQILNNPELNLVAVKNVVTGGVEMVQFASAVSGTAPIPFMTRYTLSTFLRGRLATDAHIADHAATDELLIIDSSVKPRRLPITDIGRTIKVKYVTSGQGVDNAAVTQETIRGNSLRPLAPIHIKGVRNSAGDLLITWVRRDRTFLPLRDSAGVPLPEQELIYWVEIYNVSTLVRSTRIKGKLESSTPVRWLLSEPNWATGATISDDGSIAWAFAGGGLPQFLSNDVLSGDFFFEFAIDASNTSIPANIGLYKAGDPLTFVTGITTLPTETVFGFSGTATNTVINFRGPSGSEGSSFAAAANDRLAIIRTGGVVRAYKNYINPLSEPLHTYFTEPNGQYKLGIYHNDLRDFVIKKARLIASASGTEFFNYTALMQVADFGSTQSSIKVRVYQESAIVGKGDFTEVTL